MDLLNDNLVMFLSHPIYFHFPSLTISWLNPSPKRQERVLNSTWLAWQALKTSRYLTFNSATCLAATWLTHCYKSYPKWFSWSSRNSLDSCLLAKAKDQSHRTFVLWPSRSPQMAKTAERARHQSSEWGFNRNLAWYKGRRLNGGGEN